MCAIFSYMDISKLIFLYVDFYDCYGRITRAIIYRNDCEFKGSFVYGKPPHFYDIFEAHYTCGPTSTSIKLYYFHKLSDKSRHKIHSTNVQKAIIQISNNEPTCSTFSYPVPKQSPKISTTLLDERTVRETPDILLNDSMKLLPYPTDFVFALENLLFYERSQARKLKSQKLIEFNTSKARTALWKMWFTSNQINGVDARMIDEYLLRQEPLLRIYWYFLTHFLVYY